MPCNSPEQRPITFGASSRGTSGKTRVADHKAGCAHSQQLIWQLFNAIEKGFTAAGDSDIDFLSGMCIDCSVDDGLKGDSCPYQAREDGQGLAYRALGAVTRSVVFAIITVFVIAF